MANKTVYPYGTGGSLPSSIGIVDDLVTGGADKALSAQQGKVIGQDLYGVVGENIDISGLTVVDGHIRVSTNASLNNKWYDDGASTCVFLPVTPGLEYRVVANASVRSWIAPLAVDTYGPEGSVPSYASGYSSQIEMAAGSEVTLTMPDNAVSLYIRLTNGSGDSDAPSSIFIVTVPGVVERVETLEEEVSNIKEYGLSDSASKELILGSFVNKANDSSGLPGSASTERAGMVTTLALPYRGVTLKFKLPENYVAGIRHGAKAQALSTNNYWYRDGDTFTFPGTTNYYRIVFAIQPNPNESAYETITAEGVESLVASGDIKITYDAIDLDSVRRNAPSDAYAKAVIEMLTTNSASGLDKFPIFVHTSDIHGDAYRLRDAIDQLVVNNADALLATGDFNANIVNNGFEAMETMMENTPVPTLYCRGNHETYGNSSTSFDVFATYYAKLATKWNYLKAADTVTDKTWYYKDFDAKKIRVISLDMYEKNITTNKAYALSQAQVDFFIATLKSTPANYGIIVIMHSPEAYPNNTMPIEAVEGKSDFYPYKAITIDAPAGIAGTPLRDIVDAFISRTTISTSFTQTITGGTTETITVSGDFTSGIASGVEFIAWMTGHTHSDIVGVYKNTVNRQVMLNVTCGVCYYGPSDYAYLCNGSDLPRGSFGVTQDAFNVYAIDRANKEIRIARIGSNFTEAFTDRKCMVISYANS